MTLYLDTVKYDSLEGRVLREWNCGSTIDEAILHLRKWYGFSEYSIKKVWGQLKDQYGEASVSWSPEMRARSLKKKLQNTEYAAWAGLIGPGKQLRETISKIG
jgi:hypothetical protein